MRTILLHPSGALRQRAVERHARFLQRGAAGEVLVAHRIDAEQRHRAAPGRDVLRGEVGGRREAPSGGGRLVLANPPRHELADVLGLLRTTIESIPPV